MSEHNSKNTKDREQIALKDVDRHRERSHAADAVRELRRAIDDARQSAAKVRDSMKENR